MDIHGINPQSDKGKYFRANVWYWHPLWEYCEQRHPTITASVQFGHSNDGDGLDEEEASALAAAIKADLDSGAAAHYITEREKKVAALPLAPCYLCDGTGMRGDDDCRVCQGDGTVPNFEAHRHLDLSSLTEFAEFLTDSGGFEIW